MSKTVKTRSGRVLQMPTPEEDAAITAAANADPDARPFTDEEWEQVKPLVRRGRPLGSASKPPGPGGRPAPMTPCATG